MKYVVFVQVNCCNFHIECKDKNIINVYIEDYYDITADMVQTVVISEDTCFKGDEQVNGEKYECSNGELD